MATPRTLLKILDSITNEVAPPADGEEPIHAMHVEKVRKAFIDPNIVGVGIGNKVTQGKEMEALCVCFYVVRKRPPSKVPAQYQIPPVLAGGNGDAAFTDVKVMGEFVPAMSPLIQQRPIESAYSVGHIDGTAGSLGAIVRRGNRRFILSNSHVLAKNGLANPGEKILYPGPGDGGRDPINWIATLSEAIPFTKGGAFVNEMDAALAEVFESRISDVKYVVSEATVPFEMATPQRGMTVTKRGRTTGSTTGRILDADCRLTIHYDGVGDLGFTHQVLCERYTDEGDSGALVVDVETRKVVGLHFAHAKGGSVFSPIQAIAKALRFNFTTA